MYSILIVDDEPIIRRGIKTFIDFEKYKINDIYEVEDGNSAFKTFSDVLPDLVLLDINIPFKDGLTLAQEMKEIKHDVKIAIISGYDYFEYAQKALKIGVEDYILKPVSKSDISEIISKLIYSLEEDKKYNEARKIIDKINHSEDSDKDVSNKKYKEQVRIVKEVLHSMRYSQEIGNFVKGVMIESYIEEGSQKIEEHIYGKSITDPCLGFEDSRKLLLEMAEML